MRLVKKRNKVVAQEVPVEWDAVWAVEVWEVDAAAIAVTVPLKSKVVHPLDLTAWPAAQVVFQAAQAGQVVSLEVQEDPADFQVGPAVFLVVQEAQVVQEDCHHCHHHRGQ